VPPPPATVFVGYKDVNTVRVYFVASSVGGLVTAITSYQVQVSNGGGVFQTAINCGLNLYCDIPVTTLTAVPYSFTNNQAAQFKVAASNSFGTGLYSTVV
jgi:hypothetical protein